MKAVVYTRTGDPSVLAVVDRPVPEPDPGEVLVRIAVSGVTPTDWKARQGDGSGAPPAGGWQVPHQDGAGVVEAVGTGVDPDLVGERVWIWEAAWRRPWETSSMRPVASRQATSAPASRREVRARSAHWPAPSTP